MSAAQRPSGRASVSRMDIEQARSFARQWVDAWNDHDLEAVLSHFRDDAEFSSPVAAQLLPETGGVLRGKDAIRGYWAVGLEKIPGLRFEIVDVYAGVGMIVINYRNHAGNLVAEVLQVDDAGLVVRGAGTYLVGASGA